jgi:hypothetical protein
MPIACLTSKILPLAKMPLCDLCSHLTIARLYPPNIYRHATNLAAVEQSGKTCQLCKLIHWCLQMNSEHEGSPELGFEGAIEEMLPYGQHEERNQCSIKLQIIPGKSNGQSKPGEFTHVGIWMKSKFMISSLTLSVEEGIAPYLDMSGRSINSDYRGCTGYQGVDY